jgi:CheY-like chemotaxis protein
MAKRILIADDSTVFRTLEAAFLMQRGYQVFHAADGAEAVRLAFAQKPDLILLDVQMPIMDGVSVLATLKNSPDTKHIPIIIITTIGRDSDRDILMRGGADEFVSKPIDGRDLVAKVHRLIGS